MLQRKRITRSQVWRGKSDSIDSPEVKGREREHMDAV
jgi:hypothetical protein